MRKAEPWWEMFILNVWKLILFWCLWDIAPEWNGVSERNSIRFCKGIMWILWKEHAWQCIYEYYQSVFHYPKRCLKFNLLKLQKNQGATNRPVLNSLFSVDLIVNCTTFFIHYVYHGKWWSNNLCYTLADWHYVLLKILNHCHGKIGYVQHFAKSLPWIVYRVLSPWQVWRGKLHYTFHTFLQHHSFFLIWIQ